MKILEIVLFKIRKLACLETPTRKRKTKTPCQTCGFNPLGCICSFIPRIEVSTKLVLIIHSRELKRTTNTGKLAVKSLVNSELRVRGVQGAPLRVDDLLTSNYQSTLLFYPSEEAVPLTKDFIQSLPGPIQLIVPDGNWRQAGKVHLRHPEFKNIPKVMLKIPNTAKKHLRTEHSEFGMSTLEAIAKALGVIEGEPIEKQLMQLYQLKLERTLLGRGQAL